MVHSLQVGKENALRLNKSGVRVRDGRLVEKSTLMVTRVLEK